MSGFAETWLSPTSAARLIACPASLVPTAGPAVPAQESTTNAGGLAHAAVQRWIDEGEWQAADATSLVDMFDQAAADAGADPLALRDGRLTRARLGARAGQLAAQLSRPGRATILTEREIRDPELQVWGILDIAVLGTPSAVIDLKTGRDAAGTLSDEIHLQLTVYAHLFRVLSGALPDRLEVFSLSHGVISVDPDESSVQSTLERISRARAQDPNAAFPDPDTCRFCRRRLVCAPHWERQTEWETSDALEGDLLEVTRAETGTVGILLSTIDGPAWLTQLGSDALPLNTEHGRRVRAVRVSRSHEARGPETWRAGPLTAVAIEA